MGAFTVISDTAATVGASVVDGRVTIDTGDLPGALGWELKPQGLCRDDVCIPVRDRAALVAEDRLDLAAVAGTLGRPIVVDADAAVAAIALPSELRGQALHQLTAPEFTLPDLDGAPHALHEWRGMKRLLIAFSSW